jgi:murein DD-endopeptidase MepM/ murein hydrolase activator NlpD
VNRKSTSLWSPAKKSNFSQAWLPWLSWVFAVGMIALMALLLLRRYSVVFSAGSVPSANHEEAQPEAIHDNGSETAAMPDLAMTDGATSLVRMANIHTIIPSRPREIIENYTVSKGDSIFSISVKFKIKPESILWANYDQLNDNPDMLKLGQRLAIPPVDGVWYKWQKDDKLADVAGRFKVDPAAILSWPANHLDLTNPVVKEGSFVMIPGGRREFKQWIVPIAGRKNSGTLKNLLGPGGCDVTDGAYGTGTFVWPAGNHYLSGNDFWSGHLGIDVAAGLTAPVYAADSGVVIYAGPAAGGYGNVIMIDHGNGYQTLYAHLSNYIVSCGRSVNKGQMIAQAGSTGNSTGPDRKSVV